MVNNESPPIPFYRQSEIGFEHPWLAALETTFNNVQTDIEVLQERFTAAKLARGDTPRGKPENATAKQRQSERQHALWVAVDRLETAKAALQRSTTKLSQAMWDVRSHVDASLGFLPTSPLMQHGRVSVKRIASNLVLSSMLYEDVAEAYFAVEGWLLALPPEERKNAEGAVSHLMYEHKGGPSFRRYVLAYGKFGNQVTFANGSNSPPDEPHMTLEQAHAALDTFRPTVPSDHSGRQDTAEWFVGIYDIQHERMISTQRLEPNAAA